MKRAIITDVLSTSAHYDSRDKLVGQEVKVRSAYQFNVFEEMTGRSGYVSLYYEDSEGRQGCIYGCLIDYEGVKPAWEL